MIRSKPMMIGAAVGLATFLPLVLLVALVYGGYAVMLAGVVFGTPIPSHLGARALIAFGVVLSVAGTAALFAVGGAAVGAAIAAMVRVSAAARHGAVRQEA